MIYERSLIVIFLKRKLRKNKKILMLFHIKFISIDKGMFHSKKYTLLKFRDPGL